MGCYYFLEQDDDVTDRKWSKDGDGAAEDDGKCAAEVLKEGEADVMEDREENETPTKDASTNTPSSMDKIIKLEEESGVSAPVGEAQSSLANAKDYKAGESLTRRANETRSAAETGTGSEKSSSDHLKHSDAETETSEAKAKCCKGLIFPGLQRASLMDVSDGEDKCDVKVKTSEDSDKTKASVSEIVDVNDGGRVPNVNSDGEGAVVTHASKVENLLQKFESIKRRLSDCLNSQGSPLTVKKPKRDDVVVVETGADCDDLIIVESCAEVERPIRHVSGDKCHVKKTGEGAVGKVASPSAEAKGCESDVEIVDLDVDDGQVLRGSPNGDANRDVANSKSCTEAKSGASPSPSPSPSLSGKCCESDVEIVDLNDADDVIVNDREIANVQRLDETKSDVAAAGQIGEVDGSSAKRSKRDDDDSNFSPERKRLKRDVDPDSRGKNSNCEVEIIEIEDDDENKGENGEVGRNGGNAEDSSENASGRKRDVEIPEPRGPGDGAERQTSSKQIESRERRVSDGDRTDSGARAQIIETEDSSDKHFNSANATNPDETFTETESSVRPDPRDELINNEDSSEVHTREADSLCTKSGVEIEIVHDGDRVRESEQEPNENDSKPTNSKNGVNETTIQTLAAEGPIGEVQGSDRRESGPESRALDPGPDVRFAEESETTNQRARGEGVLPRPSSPRANQEFDYVELSWEENISLMKAQIRLMEEKLRLMEMNR